MNQKLNEIKNELTVRDVVELFVHFMNNPDETVEGYRANRDMWHIFSALRGPDSRNSTLKEFTTARLRAVIGFEVMEVPVDVNPSPLSNAEIITRDDLMARDSEHFQNHFLNARRAVHNIFGKLLD